MLKEEKVLFVISEKTHQPEYSSPKQCLQLSIIIALAISFIPFLVHIFKISSSHIVFGDLTVLRTNKHFDSFTFVEQSFEDSQRRSLRLIPESKWIKPHVHLRNSNIPENNAKRKKFKSMEFISPSPGTDISSQPVALIKCDNQTACIRSWSLFIYFLKYI
jgi:hypothetical protein